MSTSDLSPVGLLGQLTVATRGDDGPGEAVFRIRGGTETFLAHSPEPLMRGQEIVCVKELGARVVEVAPWGERLDSGLRL
ncbi:hypothetical protein V3G39_00415 [Dermatophilaceae bacterium Sec6.4]